MILIVAAVPRPVNLEQKSIENCLHPNESDGRTLSVKHIMGRLSPMPHFPFGLAWSIKRGMTHCSLFQSSHSHKREPSQMCTIELKRVSFNHNHSLKWFYRTTLSTWNDHPSHNSAQWRRHYVKHSEFGGRQPFCENCQNPRGYGVVCLLFMNEREW